MGFIDSDDDFPGQSNPAKKSKLSRKKKNKENVSKPHTSTQLEQAELIQGRGGRPVRKTAEELKFQLELDAALKMSSEEVSSSSGEVLPPVNRLKEVLTFAAKAEDVLPPVNKVKGVVEEKSEASEEMSVDPPRRLLKDLTENVVDVDDILEIDAHSQGSVETEAEPGASSAETVNLEETENTVPKLMLKKKKCNIIESDDEFETEIARKVPQLKKVEDTSKKRKVEETWVVTKTKKNKCEKVAPSVGRARRKPAKKYLDSSASEDDFSDDFDGADSESGEEFSPSKSNKKKPFLNKSELVKQKSPALQKTEPLKTDAEMVRPLRLHNPSSPAVKTPPPSRSTLSYSAPRPLNIDGSLSKASAKPLPSRSFQSPVPSKALTPGPTRQVTLAPVNSTPGSISSLLSSLPKSLTKSTPLPTPSTRLVSHKMPAWTPPSRVGMLNTNSPAPSPGGIGLRVGLSRNWKASKPLHSGVKHPT